MKKLLVLVIVAWLSPLSAQVVNSWIKPSSGNWEDPTGWSLGVLPGSSQSVMITNSGWKAVAINPSTPVNFPGSMTVSNLTIRGDTNTRNVLLLNFFGTALPLTVLNGLTLQDDGRILNFNAALVVQSGTAIVTNSVMIQDGGLVRMTNAPMYLQNAEYDLTNGVFQAGQVILGQPVAARFNQYGGAVVITNLGFGQGSSGSGGAYALYGGFLTLPNGLSVIAGGGASSSYLQEGGSNQTTQVNLESGFDGGLVSFQLNGGLLADNNVNVFGDDFGSATLGQNGGTHIITNSLSLAGGSAHGQTIHPATYSLNGGTLSAGIIDLNGNSGDAVFVQSNGTTRAVTFQAHSQGFFSSFNTGITLAGGSLSCSNFTVNDGGGRFNQTGGALVVSNLLDFGGARAVGGPAGIIYGRYTLTAGTVTASNISITGDWIIGNSSTNRISNPGTFSLSHTLTISNAVEQLGRFILASNATIDLAGSASRLSFANSSGQAWIGGTTLTVSDWNGSLPGGGAEQLKFGVNASGLTAAQLNQIVFNNPSGLPSGTYQAKILSTGEIVPNNSSLPPPEIVNNWINPSSDKWEHTSSWSLGSLPASNERVNITNAGYKAVNIDNTTVSGFPNSLTVSNLMIGGTPDSANVLLLNYAGTTTPLRVLRNLNVETNGRVLMLYSAMNVSNALHVGGVFDQEGGVLAFTNSPATTMQIEGGSFNFTNAFVTGANMYLGGTNDGHVNQVGGLASLGSLTLGSGLSFPSATYLLQSGWLIVGGTEDIGENGAGAFTQNGGTNSASVLSVRSGTFAYVKNGGALFAGELLVDPPAGADVIMTHVGGITVVTNDLHLFSPGGGPQAGLAEFNMPGGSLSAGSIVINDASSFSQSTGSVDVASNLTLNGSGGSFNGTYYRISGGSLHTSNAVVSDLGFLIQTGGTVAVTNTLSIAGTDNSYQLSAGTVTVPKIVITGNLNNKPPMFVVDHASSFAVTNEDISLDGGVISLGNSTQLFGRLALLSHSRVAFAGSPAVLRFADSHTNSWQSGSQLDVANWNGSTNGGGAVQLIFGTSASALTPGQVAQIDFVNPAGFPSGTYPARILPTGEVVPVLRPTLLSSRSGSALVLTWSGNFQLRSATNVAGPYTPVSGATSPWTNQFTKPQQFFILEGM